jgi:hypothetical protein
MGRRVIDLTIDSEDPEISLFDNPLDDVGYLDDHDDDDMYDSLEEEDEFVPDEEDEKFWHEIQENELDNENLDDDDIW